MAQTQPASRRTKIEAELAQRIAELEKWEGELAEVQLIVQQLRAAVATLESYLAASSHEEPELDGMGAEHSPQWSVRERSPTEMLRAEYKGMKLGDIAAIVLQQHSPLTTAELCRIIYDTESSDEFERARNSLSAELRSGAKGDAPRWRKLGRNAYASLEQ